MPGIIFLSLFKCVFRNSWSGRLALWHPNKYQAPVWLRILACSLLLVVAAVEGSAQTHPFVGSYAVIVQMKGRPPATDWRLELREQTALSDSCRFQTYPLQLRLQPPEKVLIQNRYDNKTWERLAKAYAKKAAFMKKGHWAIALNQSERYCMIPKGNDYQFKPRIFCIVLVANNQETILAEVAPSQVYSLSTFRGRWNEMKAIALPFNMKP